MTGVDGDTLVVNRNVPDIFNGVHDDDHIDPLDADGDGDQGLVEHVDIPLNILQNDDPDAPANSVPEANLTTEPWS